MAGSYALSATKRRRICRLGVSAGRPVLVPTFRSQPLRIPLVGYGRRGGRVGTGGDAVAGVQLNMLNFAAVPIAPSASGPTT